MKIALEMVKMVDFINTIYDSNRREKLSQAIRGKGAFRRFKNTIINFGLEKQWYTYRDQCYKEIAIDWCEKNNLLFY